MNFQSFREQWLQEERAAQIHGWDFSPIANRFREGEDIPWDYEAIVRGYLSPDSKLLDIDTGGGEFLLHLGHPHPCSSATEGYPPNVALCKSTLLPLGIDFREAGDVSALPFEDSSFDIAINRHGNFCTEELFRVLKPGGLFVTQQVGAQNDRELVDLLLPNTALPFPEQFLQKAVEKGRHAGFKIVRAQESFGKIAFCDVGALVWFARIVQWEFPGFSVERCFDHLCRAQQILDREGAIEATTHRYLLVARKPAEKTAR